MNRKLAPSNRTILYGGVAGAPPYAHATTAPSFATSLLMLPIPIPLLLQGPAKARVLPSRRSVRQRVGKLIRDQQFMSTTFETPLLNRYKTRWPSVSKIVPGTVAINCRLCAKVLSAGRTNNIERIKEPANVRNILVADG